jgi:hypothetical protein
MSGKYKYTDVVVEIKGKIGIIKVGHRRKTDA